MTEDPARAAESFNRLGVVMRYHQETKHHLVADAAARLGNPALGWAYVDQKEFCPKLHLLTALRTLIVKRPAVTTVEVLAGPIRGRRKTHLVTGFVHKTYPRIYALLARTAGFNSALIVRGIEGGVVPSLRQTGKFFYYHDQSDDQSRDITPAEFGIEQSVRAAPIPEGLIASSEEADDVAAVFDATAVAQTAADAGMETLAGKAGPTRDALVCAGAVSLWHLKRYDTLKEAADAVRSVLDDGSALSRLKPS